MLFVCPGGVGVGKLLVVVANAMSKVYKIVTPQRPSTSAADAYVEKETDWGKCVLCQELTGEVLISPACSKRSTDGAGYKSLADKLLAFKNLNCLPSSMVSRLIEGENLEETLKTNKAKWHESCRLQYNKTKLERAVKRRQAESAESTDAPIHKKYTCHSSVTKADETQRCFFCGERARDAESFRHASTFDLEARVRECALQLQDQNLLAKLSTGDLIALEAKYHIQCLVSLYNRARQSRGSD